MGHRLIVPSYVAGYQLKYISEDISVLRFQVFLLHYPLVPLSPLLMPIQQLRKAKRTSGGWLSLTFGGKKKGTIRGHPHRLVLT